MHPLVLQGMAHSQTDFQDGTSAALIRQAPAMAQAKNQLRGRKTANHGQINPTLGHLVPSALGILGKIAQFTLGKTLPFFPLVTGLLQLRIRAPIKQIETAGNAIPCCWHTAMKQEQKFRFYRISRHITGNPDITVFSTVSIAQAMGNP
jgi:hypothetical protein